MRHAEWIEHEADEQRRIERADLDARFHEHSPPVPHRGYMQGGVRVQLSDVDERLCELHDVEPNKTWISREEWNDATYQMLHERRIERTLDVESVCRQLEQAAGGKEKWIFNRRQMRFVGWVL